MRRVEGDARGAPPFRVLGDGGQLFVVSTPPPALAPEPYKIAVPSATNRARRRSSFVIIAEARPATPTSRSPSPSLATGRISPFRGRGFKGPPPHAQSRPQTPEGKDKEARRPSRIDRRVSISQQNSPKRSLIPQPARRRSVSLSKTENGKASPKYGRRSTNKNYLEVTQPAAGRRGSLKVPGLSPIQGTPTKPLDKRNTQSTTKRPSPVKSRRSSINPPPKNGLKANLAARTKPPTNPVKSKTEEPGLTSPSKIPVKKGSVPDIKLTQKGTQLSQNSRRGSLAKLSVPKPGEKISRDKKEQKTDPKPNQGGGTLPGQKNSSKKTDRKTSQSTNSGEPNTSGGSPEETESSSKVNERRDDEPSLIDLLKQSSGASGTSSVVNTTTVTAAQPLQIDAIALLEGDVDRSVEKEPEVKRRNPDSARRSGAARPTAINIPSSNAGSSSSSALSGKPLQNGAQKTGTGQALSRSEDGSETKADDNSSGTKIQHQKTESMAQNSAKVSVTNGKSSSVTPQTVNGSSTTAKSVSDESADRNKTPDSIHKSANATRTRQTMESGQHHANPDGATKITKDKDGSVMEPLTNHTESQSWSTKGSGGSAEGRSTLKSSARTIRSDDRGGMTPVNVVGSDRSNSSSAVVQQGGIRRGNDDQLMGSAASLKSTAGLSTGSTDTGVSVNTVRGISSAREKHGMHMVKQPQGIETLSGNVVHLEQNGEPILSGTRNFDHDDENQGQSGEAESRWKKIFDRCCGCCKCKCSCCRTGKSMRCLACRRSLKLPKNQPTMFQGTQNAPTGCLSKLKASSSCCRLPRWKGCSRGSRVAPAENGGCCPPERRCTEVFRRLYSRCSCKRKDVTQQTRNVQAKQSLTSVAAPVLQEEPKSKIPEVLVEHNALMRGAIPCLPIPLAWFCLVWNVLIPGTGTFWSGLFNLCVGQPRFSTVASPRARIGAFLVNTVVGVGQLFTVLFCLVGWGWSIWWGVMMVRLARKYKRFRDSEAANNDVEARGADNEAPNVPPGVPSQALRGIERAR